MRLTSVLLCAACFWIGTSNYLYSEGQDSFPNLFHADVHLGMTAEALKLNHPLLARTSLHPSGQQSQGDYGLVELLNQSGHRRAIWYYIMGDMLRGVSLTVPFTEGESGALTQYLGSIYGSFINGLTRDKDERILRTNGIEGFVVTAEHWKSAKASNEYFFVATTQEISIIWFDPHFLGKDRLFVDPSMKATVDENGQRLLKKLGGSSDGIKTTKRIQIADVSRPSISRADVAIASNEKAPVQNMGNPSPIQGSQTLKPTGTTSLISMEKNDRDWMVWLLVVSAALVVFWRLLRKPAR